MKRGDVRTVKASGETQQASYLGKGMFCTAWRLVNEPQTVWCFCGEDTSKEILASCDPLPHIPVVQRIDSMEDADYIFSMPFYHPLKSANKEAWAQYRALAVALEEADRQQAPQRMKRAWYDGGYNTREYVAENAQVKEPVKAAIREIADQCCNYGDEYTFEFSPRNLAVDDNGELILLDIVFNARSVWKEQQAAIKKHRGY